MTYIILVRDPYEESSISFVSGPYEYLSAAQEGKQELAAQMGGKDETKQHLAHCRMSLHKLLPPETLVPEWER